MLITMSLSPKTIEKRWEEAVKSKAIPNWKQAVAASDIGDRWRKGLELYGIRPTDTLVQRYKSGVQSEAAAKKYEYKVTESGVAKKFIVKYVAALTGQSIKDVEQTLSS